MLKGGLPQRTQDVHGSGEWQASRGTRRHNGIDLSCYPGTLIFSPVSGVVTKLGYPYRDDLSYRYVQVTDDSQLDHRFFYILPALEMGSLCTAGETVLGEAQDLRGRYAGITNHVHYEVKRGDTYLEPKL